MPRQDFDLDALARYLHISPAQVQKLAERGQVPGRKISGHWKFSRAEIHHWLEERIGAADDKDLRDVEQVLEAAAAQRAEPDESSARIDEQLPLEAIAIPLAARTRSSVIKAMVELAANSGYLWDVETMAAAVKERENLHPTALENGVALLHPRRPLSQILAQPLLALGITSQGIPFGHSGGQLTDVFFLLCSTDDAGHLKTLARLSRLIGAAGFLNDLRSAVAPREAREVIEKYEDALDDSSSSRR